jgi:hypothetical protein
MFCVPFASTFVCSVALPTSVNKAVEASLKPCQSISFLSYLQWMVGIMCILILQLISVGALMGATMLLKPVMILTLHEHVDQGKGMLMVIESEVSSSQKFHCRTFTKQ